MPGDRRVKWLPGPELKGCRVLSGETVLGELHAGLGDTVTGCVFSAHASISYIKSGVFKHETRLCTDQRTKRL